MEDIRDSLRKLSVAFDAACRNEVSLVQSGSVESLVSYKATKHEYLRRNFHNALAGFIRRLDGASKTEAINSIRDIASKLRFDDPKKMQKDIVRISTLLDSIKETPRTLELKELVLPDEIRSEVLADIKELESCFNHGLYRSAIILCGRVLETVLHRKYYEKVGVDLLEKSPGIGLGKIIAKLQEKDVELDPGLTQQIHLINQVRIFTVHKKQQAFHPSKAQAHAMILYTMDVIEKLF